MLSWEGQEPSGLRHTILLAEPNAAVRRAMRRTLEKANYEVLETCNGEQALNVCRRHSGPIHLLLSDIALPGVHGPDLARLVTGMRPLIRVVFLTAEPEEATQQAGLCRGCWLLVRKPFRPSELARAMEELLRPNPTPPILAQAGLAD